MSAIIPNKDCALQLESQVNGYENLGNTDIIHFISDGTVVSWIDFDGVPGGNLAAGASEVSVNGTPVNDPNFVAGAGATLTVSGSNITVAAPGAGVTSLNALTGALAITPGSNITVSPSGSNITISAAATASNTPWADIQAFNTIPHKFAFNQPTAGATVVSGSPLVTLSVTGGLYSKLINGQGVCIWAAGAVNSGTTPSAPTVTSPPITGSQTITYQIVGYDAKGGLTAASTGATVAAPNVFSPLPIAISSISASAGTVTANFASPLNGTSGSVSAGMTIHITGVSGSGSGWNGIWTIATAPTTQQVTFAVSGATGTGTASGATGRLSNTQPITAISRDINGVITVTTAQSHSYQAGTQFAPSVIIIENCTPTSLNGYYRIATASGTSITAQSGVYNSAVTGSVIAGSSTVTVWEYLLVACPQLSGGILGYYIYSDSPNPGNGLVLIGKTPLGDINFTDYGQCFLSGYTAPLYVPGTPPSSAQNQMLSTTIASGAGTTNLVLNTNPSTSIGSFGATLMYDDGPNLLAACAVASGNTATTGTVILSPPNSNSDFSGYIFNSPITIPQNVNIIFACEAIINETWTFTSLNQVTAQFGTTSVAAPAFPTQNFCNINGIANPIFYLGENIGNTGGITIDGLCFTLHANGQTAIIDTCFYTRIANCGFKSGLSLASQGSQMAIIYLGSCSLSEAENLNCALANRFYGNGVPGQSSLSPVGLPAIWFRGSSNTALANYNDNTAQFIFRGKHSMNGRGITFDHRYSTGNGNQGPITIGAAIWMQQGITPVVTAVGDIFYGFDILNVLNDTSVCPTLANLGFNAHDFSVKNCSVGNGYSVVQGNLVTNLSASGNTLQIQNQCQRIVSTSFTTSGGIVDVVNLPNSDSNVGASLLYAQNSSAALDLASGLAYILYVFSGQVTVVHSATSGMTFGISATLGN